MKHFARAVKKGKVWWADLGQLQGFLPSRRGEKEKSGAHGLRQRQGHYLPIAINWLFTNFHLRHNRLHGLQEITAPLHSLQVNLCSEKKKKRKQVWNSSIIISPRPASLMLKWLGEVQSVKRHEVQNGFKTTKTFPCLTKSLRLLLCQVCSTSEIIKPLAAFPVEH